MNGRTAARFGAAILVAALGTAGCGGAGSEVDSPGTIAWNGCGDLQCATLVVPLDHRDPGGRKIEISVVRRPADDPGRRLGSLVVNPGGPGGSGVEFVRDGAQQYFDAETRSRFDVIGFDPRGVGKSAPVRCLPDDEPEPDGAGGVEQIQRSVTACAERTGGVLPHMTTAATARDMELLRIALGDEKLTYLGISYGTVLGATYADLFPDRVRAMVLDGPVDPAVWFGDRTVMDRERAVAFQRALEAFFTGCLRNGRACTFGNGDPAGGLDRLLRATDVTPIPVRDGPPLDRDEAVAGITAALFDEESWFDLATALREAQDGEGRGLRELAAEPGFAGDAHVAVVCADTNDRLTPAALQEQVPELTRLSPVFGPMSNSYELCSFWPPAAAPYRPGPVVAAGAPPILVVGTTGDPATPLPGAVATAKHLESGVLLTLDAWRHGAYGGGSPCVDAAVERCLAELVAPPEGSACPREPAGR